MSARKLQHNTHASNGQNSQYKLRVVEDPNTSTLEEIYKSEIAQEEQAQKEIELKTLAQKEQEETLAPIVPLHPDKNYKDQEAKENNGLLDKSARFLQNRSNGTAQRLGKFLENILGNRNELRTKGIIYANLVAVFGNTFTAITQLLPKKFKFIKKLGLFTGESFRASTLINALGSALIGRKQKDPVYTGAQIGDAAQAFGDREETYFNRAPCIGAYNAADYGKQILQEAQSSEETSKNGEYESYSHGAWSMLKVPSIIWNKISNNGLKAALEDQNIKGYGLNIALMFTPLVKLSSKISKKLSWFPYLYRNTISVLGEFAGLSSKNGNKPIWRTARLGFLISTLFAQFAKTPFMPEWAKHVFSSINFAMDSGSKILSMESRNRREISDNPHHEHLSIFDSVKYTMNTMAGMLTDKDSSKASAPIIPIETIKQDQQATNTEASQVLVEQDKSKNENTQTKAAVTTRRTPVTNRYFVNRPSFKVTTDASATPSEKSRPRGGDRKILAQKPTEKERPKGKKRIPQETQDKQLKKVI